MSQVRQASVFSSTACEELQARVVALALDYLSLTKPKILILLLLSTCCPMILASAGAVEFRLVFLTLIAGALTSGSASAINCIWDIDIDAQMRRTKDRPLPAGRIGRPAALCFSFVLGLLGIGIFYYCVNPLAAGIALFGHFFYVFIYTMWLKRSTPQNIVIGGVAGAVPPMVGWVAVTGELHVSAFLLFFLIFFWTPPHFWALALNKNADYQRAGVPMLPVVAGESVTYRQMFWYAFALVPVTALLLYIDPQLGLFSLLTLLPLNFLFVWKVFALRKSSAEDKSRNAWQVFGFSVFYLAFSFIFMLVDSTLL